jgi:hypothetical protein
LVRWKEVVIMTKRSQNPLSSSRTMLKTIHSFVCDKPYLFISIKRQLFISQSSTVSFKSTFSTHSHSHSNDKQKEYKFELYEKLYEKSLKEPEEFWGKFAKNIHWSQSTTTFVMNITQERRFDF